MYYPPDAIRSIWHHDISPIRRVLGIFGYGYSPKKEVKAEANNLVVSEFKEEVNSCLGISLYESTILTEEQLRKIKKCGFDISKLNPVANPLIDVVPTPQVNSKVVFPEESEKITFRKMKYSSSGSPKLQASFIRNGKKHKIKIKMGFEVHSEITTSELAKSLGMHQDPIMPRKKVKLFLGKLSYEAFTTMWKRKYRKDNRDIANYME